MEADSHAWVVPTLKPNKRCHRASPRVTIGPGRGCKQTAAAESGGGGGSTEVTGSTVAAAREKGRRASGENGAGVEARASFWTPRAWKRVQCERQPAGYISLHPKRNHLGSRPFARENGLEPRPPPCHRDVDRVDAFYDRGSIFLPKYFSLMGLLNLATTKHRLFRCQPRPWNCSSG